MKGRRRFSYCEQAEQYVRDVVAGEIVACELTIKACQRHLDDLKRSKSKAFPYKFDPERAERKAKFMHLLPHVKGKWARKVPGKPNAHLQKLAPWQLFIVCCLFGWVKKSSGFRRFRKGSVYVPRKNGKSLLAADIGLAMFCFDDEIGAEVYSGATTEKQAWEVFAPARRICLNDPRLVKAFDIEVNAANLARVLDGSKFEPVIGKPGDGASPHCAIHDEYHEHPSSDQYDTMSTGMGARDQPLQLVISTAGDNIASPCYEDWLTCKKILEGVLEDDTHFAIIYTIDKDDDWTSEIALRKANPNFDVSVSAEYLQLQIRDGINHAAKASRVKTKHLNLWVTARDAYFNLQRWQECMDVSLDMDAMNGRECWIGLDLASKVDLAALELLFPLSDGRYARFGRYYLPEATVELPENQQYRTWRDQGWLTVTPGNIIDFTQILRDLVEFAGRFKIREVPYDPHQATMLVTAAMDEGLPMIEFRPTVLNYSEPMKFMDGMIRDRKYRHNGDPVFNWALGNVVAKLDAKDNVYPRKELEKNKIDPVVAHISALGRAMTAGGGKSFWE